MALRNFKIVSINNQPINYNTKIIIKDYQSPIDAAKKVLKLISLNMNENEKLKLKSTFMIKEISSKKIYGPYKGTYVRVDKLKIKPSVKLCKKLMKGGYVNGNENGNKITPVPPPPLHGPKLIHTFDPYYLSMNYRIEIKNSIGDIVYSSILFNLFPPKKYYIYLIENESECSQCPIKFKINLDSDKYTIDIKELAHYGSTTSFINIFIIQNSFICFTESKIE